MGAVAGAAFGVEKTQQVLQCRGAGAVAKKGPFAADFDQILVFQLVEMVGKRRRGNFQLRLDFADHQAFRMRRRDSVPMAANISA
jgi:hypothetical protein